MTPKITVTRSTRISAQTVRARLEAISRSDVLVGIPQARNSRKGEPVGNAGLLYIHTHGSPAHRIPARPVIEPAIAADGNRQIIGQELANAAKAHLGGDPAKAETDLARAGIAGMNAAKGWFTDGRNQWPPNRPSTIRRKKSSRPLIDTGALRRNITYVVRAVR